MLKYKLHNEIIPAYEVKAADDYTESEILELVESVKKAPQKERAYLYDTLIDRLYLRKDRNLHAPIRTQFQYSFLTARQLLRKEKSTVSIHDMNI